MLLLPLFTNNIDHKGIYDNPRKRGRRVMSECGFGPFDTGCHYAPPLLTLEFLPQSVTHTKTTHPLKPVLWWSSALVGRQTAGSGLLLVSAFSGCYKTLVGFVWFSLVAPYIANSSHTALGGTLYCKRLAHNSLKSSIGLLASSSS